MSPRKARRGRYAALLLTLGFGVIGALPARAGEIPLPGENRSVNATLTQTLLGHYHTDVDVLDGNDNETYGDIQNRTNIVLLSGSTTFNLRVDGAGFVGTDDDSEHQGQVGLEKISLSSVQRNFDITAGDFYVRLGRGLALDLTRVNELFRDTTLRGAQLRIRTPVVDGMVFGGWSNALDLDSFSEVPVNVPADVIGGARVEVRPSRQVTLGFHYAGGGMEATEGLSRNATHTLGGSVELPRVGQSVNLYAEADYMSRAQGMEIIHGLGTYFSGSGNFGPVAALVEFKYYRHLQFINDQGSEEDTFIYNRPPTLMRTKAELINNHDVIGPRARLDWQVGPWGTVLFGNYGYFFRSDAAAEQPFFESGITIHDAYGGIQQPLGQGALDISGGYRLDTLTDEQGQSVTDYSQAFAEAELSWVMVAGHTLELEAEYRNIEKAAEKFWDFYLAVGYRPRDWVSVGFSYEYSDEFKDPDPNDAVSVRNHYGGVRATVNFNPSSYARVFAGSTHGGVRCIDGFCREIPPFIGTKLELVVSL